MRAVDLLQSLDFVDPERIGAIGHSMGSITTYLTMALDPRIKAGVRSSTGIDEYLLLIAPRLLITLHGALDGSADHVK
jgi:dipeptidyl aminopeptidase/acylaminoacyl peptidase